MKLAEQYLKKIEKCCDVFKKNEDMSQHCSFKCGGKAKFFCEPKNEKCFVKVLKFSKKAKLQFFVLGNGTNTLFKNFNGIVISTKKLNKIKAKKNTIICQCGATFAQIGQLCTKNSLSGFEFATGIPASVGGGVYNNAGAYGKCMSDVIEKVKIFNGKKCCWCSKSFMSFDYRKSIVQMRELFVLGVKLKLKSGDKNKIQKEMLEILQKRRSAQPLEFPSAGSVFKRQGEIIPAKVIDKLGLKGFNINDAQVSEKHAGFIVNRKNATFQDVENLIEVIKQKVFEKEGIILLTEIEIIGD